jgi:hypothetical protein
VNFKLSWWRKTVMGFLFLSEATDLPTKITDLTKDQGGYFNQPAENTKHN